MADCRIMGILNATPDSFSDGGDAANLERELERVADADIIDVGGESTRPGHDPVPVDEEIARVVPVIQAVRARYPAKAVSIDTRKAQVATAALDAGASMVNDVGGLEDPAMAPLVASARCDVVLMRSQSLEQASCQQQLHSMVQRALDAGVDPARIIVDPGLGFGDVPGADPEANLALVRDQSYTDYPVLIGASRKRFIGTLTGVSEPKQRVIGSVAVAVLAALSGAAIVRVHDVAQTREALRALGQ